MENQEKREREEKDKKDPVFHYTVDGEEQSTSDHTMTAIQIMERAGVDPNSHYLVQMVGNNRVSYKDNPSEQIKMHNHMVFFTNSLGSTPVS